MIRRSLRRGDQPTPEKTEKSSTPQNASKEKIEALAERELV